MQETKYLLRQEKFKQKLGKKGFYYDMEKVSFPVTTKQAKGT